MSSVFSPTLPREGLDVLTAPHPEQMMAYLRYTRQFADHIANFCRDTVILETCNSLGLTVSDRELQQCGDEFRFKHKLLTPEATQDWLAQQAISLEDWIQGLQMECLKSALQDHLFGEQVDAHYLANRETYRRVALSQIVMSDRVTAQKIYHQLQDNPAQFCAVAIQHSQTMMPHDTGGYVGIRYCAELAPEIQSAIQQQEAGTVLEPLYLAHSYYVMKVEAWIPTVLDQTLRRDMMAILFENWLKEQEK